jgi:hypothetical protein
VLRTQHEEVTLNRMPWHYVFGIMYSALHTKVLNKQGLETRWMTWRILFSCPCERCGGSAVFVYEVVHDLIQVLGPCRYSSPRHRMPMQFKKRWMTLQMISTSPSYQMGGGDARLDVWLHCGQRACRKLPGRVHRGEVRRAGVKGG